MIGERFNGGRAEYCVADAKQLVRIPDSVSFEVAGVMRNALTLTEPGAEVPDGGILK